MAWTDQETARVTLVETVLNQMQNAVANLMNKKQFRQLMAINQAEMEALTARVAVLETQLATLTARVNEL